MQLATVSTSLQKLIDEARRAHHVPGASLAVLRDGRIAAAASGVLNLDTGVDATSDSLFQIGSITKVWTATVVMGLVDDGVVELDAPLRRYIPQFAVGDDSVRDRVTIRHLLTHSSGIDGDNFSDTGRGDDALEKYVATCAALAQVHPVGATMSYCNTGFTLLGRVIELVTGQVWDAAIRERLFDRLALTHTATLPEDVLRFRAAIGHISPAGELVTAPMWGLPRTAGPAGAICSTASEVVRFAQLHLEGGSLDGEQLLEPGTVAAMQEPQVGIPSGGVGTSGSDWGLGWELFEWSGRKVIGHDGGTIGQAAFLRAVPDAGVAIALLTNGGNVLGMFRDVFEPLLAETAGIALPGELVPPETPLPVDASAYVGVYEREGASIRVEPHGEGIVAIQTTTGLGAEMMPEPFELPLHRLRADDDLFLTEHPAAPGSCLPVRFVTLEDGSRVLHLGGRATPRVG
ncbi:MAG TPA: serine hydrolase domain-containing protein [Gaiellaceae bacterium]|nr:serine hydrolase domain-containing protein [Gaiellaceae bacterium]